MSEPIFIVNSAGDYTCISDNGEVVIEAQNVRWVGDKLQGELRVTSGTAEVIGPVDVSFLSPVSRRDVLRVAGDGADVASTLNTLCHHVVNHERENTSPVVTLSEVDKPSPIREYIVPLLPPLPRTHPAIWFGDGGVGKSLLLLYAAGHLAAQGVKVLYLDWELDQDEQRLRYEQIFGAKMPARLKYLRCDKPLAQSVASIKQKIQQHSIDYVVCDSLAYGCGGPPEQSEMAIQYMQAIRMLGVGSLHVAHVPKGGDTSKPFGSTFWHNSARSTWYIEAVEHTDNGDVDSTRLGLYHRKTNFGPKEATRYLNMVIGKNRGPFRLTKGLALKNRQASSMAESIRAALTTEPVLRADVKRQLSIDKKTSNAFRQAISRGAEAGWLIAKGDTLSLAA